MRQCSIRVVVRFRPINDQEKKEGENINFPFDIIDEKRVNILEKSLFTFDHVFAPDSPQDIMYEYTARQTIEDVLNGYNGTIITYGQRGSGKTFTMFGPDIITSENEIGIIPRASTHLFSIIEKESKQTHYSIKASFLEIRKEKIRDLLASCTTLSIRESPTKGMYIKKVKEEYVTCEEDILALIRRGKSSQRSLSSHKNNRNSFSHILFIITVEQRNLSDNSIKISTLNLIDLADTKTLGNPLHTSEQPTKTNQSLYTLENCIHALTGCTDEAIPYRDSKLTRFLQNSLGGNTKTTIIITASPTIIDMEETTRNLQLGARAKNIVNMVSQCVKESVEELEGIIADLQGELEELKKFSISHAIPIQQDSIEFHSSLPSTEKTIPSSLDQKGSSNSSNVTPRKSSKKKVVATTEDNHKDKTSSTSIISKQKEGHTRTNPIRKVESSKASKVTKSTPNTSTKATTLKSKRKKQRKPSRSTSSSSLKRNSLKVKEIKLPTSKSRETLVKKRSTTGSSRKTSRRLSKTVHGTSATLCTYRSVSTSVRYVEECTEKKEPFQGSVGERKTNFSLALGVEVFLLREHLEKKVAQLRQETSKYKKNVEILQEPLHRRPFQTEEINSTMKRMKELREAQEASTGPQQEKFSELENAYLQQQQQYDFVRSTLERKVFELAEAATVLEEPQQKEIAESGECEGNKVVQGVQKKSGKVMDWKQKLERIQTSHCTSLESISDLELSIRMLEETVNTTDRYLAESKEEAEESQEEDEKCMLQLQNENKNSLEDENLEKMIVQLQEENSQLLQENEACNRLLEEALSKSRMFGTSKRPMEEKIDFTTIRSGLRTTDHAEQLW